MRKPKRYANVKEKKKEIEGSELIDSLRNKEVLKVFVNGNDKGFLFKDDDGEYKILSVTWDKVSVNTTPVLEEVKDGDVRTTVNDPLLYRYTGVGCKVVADKDLTEPCPRTYTITSEELHYSIGSWYAHTDTNYLTIIHPGTFKIIQKSQALGAGASMDLKDWLE